MKLRIQGRALEGEPALEKGNKTSVIAEELVRAAAIGLLYWKTLVPLLVSNLLCLLF